MVTRRNIIKALGIATFSTALPQFVFSEIKSKNPNFRFSLNTSTIRGQKPGLLKYIEIASNAGYDGIELWVEDVKQHLDSGNSASSLRKYISDRNIRVENAIGFAPWLTGETGMKQMKTEMLMMAEIGCTRIAAPASGVSSEQEFNLNDAGEKYRKLLEIGRSVGVKPILEFWGASKVLHHMGQAMMIAALANDPDVCILADVFHMFRGDSGFDSLKMLSGNVIEVFHMNDYLDAIPRENQKDSDRVYPGDGVAPMKQILTDLKNMGGEKILSLELFNETYWTQDPLLVAKTGLEKMKKLVSEVE
jgi:sugar phosphate isomerase/epimerase